MKVYQNVYHSESWQTPLERQENAQLVLLFGDPELAKNEKVRSDLERCFSNAEIIGCSTAGEIQNIAVHDNSLCLTALSLESGSTRVVSDKINSVDITQFSHDLASRLPQEGLEAILVLSDGHTVNGTALVNGLSQALPESVEVFGGLAGDGPRFEETFVWHNEAIGAERVVLCGFYGSALRFQFGCEGGWSAFGPPRTVTKSSANVLYELDNKPALELYKTYLGKYSKELPSSALLFPLMIDDASEGTRIRTVLDIDRDNNTMIFAGDVPEGASVQLMHSSVSGLIDGAASSAGSAFQNMKGISGDALALVVSCIGRRLLLKSRVDEELETISNINVLNIPTTGFYSYGELSPMQKGKPCMLHNQTVTITTLYEAYE